MEYFIDDVTLPIIKENGYKRILEIGASLGDNSRHVLNVPGSHLTIIDPGYDCDLAKKFSERNNLTVMKAVSLKGLSQVQSSFDCIFIDGDHNWYTVYNELKIIAEHNLLKAGGTIFFHDVGWPYGRRDMYYTPELIPAEFRKPYAKKGMWPGQSSLDDHEGFNPHYFNALEEGGGRNGVLTAIEDFVRDFGQGDYFFLMDHRQHGLGILIRRKDRQTSSLVRRWFFKLKYIEVKTAVEDFLKSKCPTLAKTLIQIKKVIK